MIVVFGLFAGAFTAWSIVEWREPFEEAMRSSRDFARENHSWRDSSRPWGAFTMYIVPSIISGLAALLVSTQISKLTLFSGLMMLLAGAVCCWIGAIVTLDSMLDYTTLGMKRVVFGAAVAFFAAPSLVLTYVDQAWE